MATQINSLTLEGFEERAENLCVSLGKKHILNKRFSVGEKPDFTDVKKTNTLIRILKNSCSLSKEEIKKVKECLNKLTL